MNEKFPPIRKQENAKVNNNLFKTYKAGKNENWDPRVLCGRYVSMQSRIWCIWYKAVVIYI